MLWIGPVLALSPGCRRAAPPDILLVTLDTTRIDAVGAYSSRPSVTPRIDALAAEGIRFDRAYTVTPLTIPAHSSLHTGLLPSRHGVRDNGDGWLQPEADTLAEGLKERGYATMASIGAEVTSRHWGFDQGFDAYFDDLSDAGSGGNRWRVERPGEAVVDDALGWIAEHDPEDAPWFAWVHLFDAHYPYAPPEPWRSEYSRDPYLGEIAHLDAVVGRLLDGLPEGALDRAWVVVVADHGEALGAHGEAMHGTLLYDPTTRIPQIVRPPGGGPPRTVRSPTSIVDLHPTLLSIAGRPSAREVDGFDLSRVLRGEWEGPRERAVMVESLFGWLHFGWAPQRAWIDGSHKLLSSAHPELYAITDTDEANDLAAAEPERVASLTADLDAYRATRSPRFALQRIDGERRAQLEALGYVVPEILPGPVDPDPAGLLDPVDGLPLLRQIEQARQAWQQRDTEAARAHLASAIAADPGLLDARLMLAAIDSAQGQSAAALATLDEVLALRPSPRARLMAASLRLQRGETDEARLLAEAALDSDPYGAAGWDTYLTVLLAQGDAVSLHAALAEARQRLPDDRDVLAFAAVVHLMDGEPDPDAADAIRAALDGGSHPFFQLGLGLAELARGNDAGAEGALTEEIALFPPAIPARRSLVALYADQRRYGEQLAQLDAISAAEEPRVDTMHSRAQALFNLGRYPEAERAVAECRAFAPTYAPCAMLEANVYDKLGRSEDAKRAWREALVLAGKAPPPGGEPP